LSYMDYSFHFMSQDQLQNQLIPDDVGNFGIDANAVSILNALYTVKFDVDGINKQYNLKAINLSIPAENTENEIETGVIWFKSEDLERVLRADKRATVIMDDVETNYFDLLENRKLKLTFIKSSHLSVIED